MELLTERVDDIGGVTFFVNNDEKFYCVEDILSNFGVDTKPCGSEQTPFALEGRCVFAYKMRDGDIVHSLFIDRNGLEKIKRRFQS